MTQFATTQADMSHATAKVAVILTCYNEGAYIGAAVRSVLEQTWVSCVQEIVIADDGSAADTVAVLRDIESWDSRIRVLYGAGGRGLPAQRNWAIAATRAPLLAILDGDDLWAANKLELQLPALLADPAIGLVYSGYYAFAGNSLGTAKQAAVRDISAARHLRREYFLNDPPIIPSTTLLRRGCFEACGGFDATIRVFEDTDFYLRLARVCRFAFVQAPLLYKRSRESSITRMHKDLLAHHAFVALKAAADDPQLLALVPRRLAERARKLGNVHFVIDESSAEALRLLKFALRLDPFNLRTWASLIGAGCFAPLIRRLFEPQLRSRRAALGRVDG